MNNYVLWLASWYPSRVHPTNGDFVERHARAVAAYIPVVVLLVEKDGQLQEGETIIDITEEPGLTVYRVYYGRTSRFRFFEKIGSFIKYRRLQKRIYHSVVTKYSEPILVHVHVAMKAGILALHLLRRYKIPFLLTEHWTGYYKESDPNYYSTSPVMQRLIRKTINKASQLFTVSSDLGRTIQQKIAPVNYQVIPNTVDTSAFSYEGFTPPVFRFIHPSYLNYQKNPEGMINASAILSGQGYVFELYLLGNKDEKLEALAKDKGLLNSFVFVQAAVSYKEVAVQMKQSSALLMFSRFENLPCVILEALCCGLPVISSRVGGIAEVINENNGLLVSSGNIEELAEAMKRMMETYSIYERAAIAAAASEKYSYAAVGAQYYEWYNKMVRHK